MVKPKLKALVDQLSDAERRDLLHYLEHTAEDNFALTSEQADELERRDAELAGGAVTALTAEEFTQRVRDRLQ